MVKKKSIPKKAPDTPSKRRKQTRLYKIGNKDFKVNVTTLRSIRTAQMSTKLCIPRLPFSKLIREILLEHGSAEHRIQIQALLALQEAAEIYLTYLFEDTNKCAHHAKRITIRPNDMRLVLEIKGCSDPGYVT